ncbi:putative autophagy regulatory protein Atg2 [Aspergillus undulatus]|uniref:putative autophagy regulatory protein Atg2 n=1 Tax=Aspergillus undulatus TaxID=1810928 RepID=UPI003CCD3CB6
MASYLPGYFQKRLLKYALSRLEFIDTEALDPDSLGIRWGQRSTVELRDIGLRLEKIAKLLNLSTSSQLLSARIRHLQLTVPADIYSSGIICEVSGVEVHLRLPSEKEACATKDRLFEGHESIIPNPADLAESFLQTEPKEEKEELQAAISSRSEILHRTTASISDDEEELGLGDESVSLPSFVAAFLRGIADRLQFLVEDISIRVDVETKQEGSSKRQPEDKPDLISALVSVRQVSVGAVTTISSNDEHFLHSGKRPISLRNVDFSLIAEPMVFSNYSRFTAPGSPSTPLPLKASQPSSPASSIPRAPSSASSSSHAMMASTIFEPSQQMMDLPHPEHDVPGLHESAYTYDGRFSDADTEETRSHGYLEQSQTFSDDERLLDNPAYLDSVIDSQLQDDDLGDLDNDPPEEFNQPDTDTSTPRLQSSGYHVPGDNGTRSMLDKASVTAASGPNVRNIHRAYSRKENYAPQSSIPNLTHLPEDVANEHIRTLPVRPPLSSANSSSSSASGSLDDELAESKLFSSEQAQSMYMSAMSHGSNSRSYMPNMPGAWESPEATLIRGDAHHDNYTNPADGATALGEDNQDNTPVSTPTPMGNEGEYPFGNAFESAPTDKRSVNSTSDVEATDAAKRFLHIDRITIWIPSLKQEKEHQDTSDSFHAGPIDQFEDSTAHLEASQPPEKSVSFSKTPISPRSRRDSDDLAFGDNYTKQGQGTHGSKNEIAFELSSVEIQFDIAIGWLVVKFGQRVLQAFDGDGQASKSEKSFQKGSQEPRAFSLTLGKLAINFVQSVPGSPFPSEKQQLPTSFAGTLRDDIILQTTASGLRARFSNSKNLTTLSARVSKFTVGFASEDLISFSEEFKMRESTRDILAPAGNDVSLSLNKSPESATLAIHTLPLHVNLNIPRLEELLGWFGGLSTIMELGSSISSMSGNKAPKKDAPKRTRGVRFEGTPPPSSESQNTSIPWAINVRIGGIAVDVTGESHYLTLRTTAAKIISRPAVIVLSIDKTWLDGPFSLHNSRDAPIHVSLNVIRVEYLYTPIERDLDRLLSLITPSKSRYGEEDDIMIDTLFRQRKQGSVLRVTLKGAKVNISRPELGPLQQLGEEIGRLSTVTKYLPEDDRPGILTLALIEDLEARLHVGGMIGTITANLQNAEAAHISIPSLVAAQLDSIRVVRNGDEELLGEAIPSMPEPIPVLMVRLIADEMDPTIKVKLHNLRVEYTISAITALLGISDETASGDVAANMASSLVNIAELHPSSQETPKEESSGSSVKPLKLTVDMLDCVIGLNPRGTAARGLVVLTESRFGGAVHDLSSSEATFDLRKASILIIDDADNVDVPHHFQRRRAPTSLTAQIQSFLDMGYVSVSTISSATATIKIMLLDDDGTKSLDVEVRDDLLILETCADSTQTLISILNGLQPPSPPSVVEKYRTQVVPIQNMLESFTGSAFSMGPDDPLSEVVDMAEISGQDDLEYVTDFESVPPESGRAGGKFESQYHVSSSMSELDFRDDHFMQKSSVGGTAHRWDSTQNTYGLADDSKLQKSPLRVRVRDAHVIWNLFDGYDWQRTRDTISQAVKNVEKKAAERRANGRGSPGFEEEEEDVIGDCLFNSVYIGIPANRDPSELRDGINRNIDDVISETGSYATTSTATTIRRNTSPGVKRKKLRLSRSKAHKMTFELKRICADLVVFPPNSGETLNSLDIRVDELVVFDHIPTSTWKKFATYMREAGEKETGTSMVHLEILTVKPVSELAASELILKVTVLPLRLHVDQDALDFLTRFFEFRDDSAPSSGDPQERPYLQRSEVNAIPVKLDFKPKRVDYAGLRSGRTTEFMNFIILDEADMVLKRVIVYGADGFDKLGQTLNDTWMPEIKQNQLPGILAGLAPIRPLVNVGSGVRDLVMIPMREYRKDGRIVRSIQKGAFAFGKTTSNELVKLGAKLAIGTQTVLQGAEELFNAQSGQPAGGDDDETDEDEAARKISLYADQPLGIRQGLRGGFRGLERDLLLTRDTIIAMPADVQDSGSAKAAAKAVLKRAPTIILRPAIGISKAVGQTLLGAGNSLDPSNRRKIEDKYKRH